MAREIRVTVVKKDKWEGRRLFPGDVIFLPEHAVRLLGKSVEPVKETTDSPMLSNYEKNVPEGAMTLIKLPGE